MERNDLINSLEKIRMKSLCCYMTPNMCDCKYGLEDLRDKLNPVFTGGEQTGCCEMREAIGILRMMTDREYNGFIKRGHKKVAKAWKQLKKEGKLDGLYEKKF